MSAPVTSHTCLIGHCVARESGRSDPSACLRLVNPIGWIVIRRWTPPTSTLIPHIQRVERLQRTRYQGRYPSEVSHSTTYVECRAPIGFITSLQGGNNGYQGFTLFSFQYNDSLANLASSNNSFGACVRQPADSEKTATFKRSCAFFLYFLLSLSASLSSSEHTSRSLPSDGLSPDRHLHGGL